MAFARPDPWIPVSRVSFSMIHSIAVVLLGALLGPVAHAASPGSRTYANPVDIDYRYNFEQVNEGISYRTGADPVIVRHGDAYYLFLTLADGYWRSTNLVDWTFVTPNRWPFSSMVAPAAISDGDRLLLMRATMEPEPILVTTRNPTKSHRALGIRICSRTTTAVGTCIGVHSSVFRCSVSKSIRHKASAISASRIP
jgi:hypothetical protein